jgi:YaiO family outer membrane protein
MFKYTTTIVTKIFVALLLLVSVQGFAQELTAEQHFALAKKEGKEKNNFAKAAIHCEKALAITPLDMDIKEYLGKCYMETGRLDKARITLLEVLDKSPRRVDARHYLLNIEAQSKRYSSAVCYANELLEITPYSKTLWMRKINLYNLMNNTVEANRETKRLYQIFPDDKEIRAMYNSVLTEDAVKMNKGGNLSGAASQYEEALKVNTKDPELYLNLMNLQIKMGEYPAAISTADKGLYHLPGNRDIFNKKIAVLQEMHEYQKAGDLVRAQLKKGPSSYYSNMLADITAEAARYYRNSDPYELYGQVYERDKSNREAHDYLLNTAISRGYYGDAQELLNKALKANPTSKSLLVKQLYVYESQNNTQAARGIIERLYSYYPQDTDIAAKYHGYVFREAKDDFADGNYKASLPVFIRLSNHPEYGKSANNYIYSVYLAQKDYDKALVQIDRLIRQNPGQNDYILKKIDLLGDMNNFEAAFELAREYRQKYPDNSEFAYMLNELSIDYIKYLNENEDYATVKIVAEELIANDPYNLLAYNYGIGALVSMGEYEQATALTQAALEKYPESKELRLKQAGILSQSGRHEDAVAALRALHKDYPYNSTIKGSLIEAMYMYGKQLEEKDEYEQATALYREVLVMKPQESIAAIKLANVLIAREEYNEALGVVNKSLEYNKDNNDLLFLKGIIYEKMNDFPQAIAYQSKYIPPAHKVAEHQDHLDYLDAKSLKNQIILSYLKATTDSIAFNTSVATIEYLRYEKRDTYVARVNYAARNSGVGVQGEIDWYHTFSDKSYILANAGISNRFFQKYKVALSYFEPLGKGWTGEVGARYARLTDERNLFTGIFGIEKAYERVWLNARVQVVSDEEDLYHNILGQARFYMRNGRDYALAMASAGTTPEDQKLDFQTNTFLSYVNTMVGAGYFHNTSHRTTIGLMGNWYNYRISPDYYLNQYNLFLTLRTRF